MVMIGRRDEHRVDLLVHGVEHPPVIRERPRLRALRGSLLGGSRKALVVHIYDSDEVLGQRTVQAHLASPAATNDGSAQFPLGLNVGKEEHSLERLRGSHREGGAFQKGSATGFVWH